MYLFHNMISYIIQLAIFHGMDFKHLAFQMLRNIVVMTIIRSLFHCDLCFFLKS